MKFSEVIDALIEGKPISRTGWPDGRFLYLEKEHNWFVYQIKKDDEVDDYEMITYTLDLSPEDVAADDWDIDEWDLEGRVDEETRDCPEFAKEIIEDYIQAKENGEILNG